MKNCSWCGRDNDDDALFCRECGTKFELPKPAVDPELTDPSLDLVVVKTCGNVVDAGMVKARLEAAGIEACVPEELTPQLFWNVIPSPIEAITVRVAQKDYEAAQAILADFADTALTAPHPGWDPEQSESGKQTTRPADPVIPADAPRKTCVSCGTTIPADAEFCPKCGWTQPDRE